MTMEQLNWRGIETEPTDAALIDRSRRAAEAFATLFDRHGDRVYRYLARRVGADEADDLVSETFVVAFEQRHTFDPSRSPAGALPWLLGIGTNLVRGHRRSELRRWNALARANTDLTEPSPADRVAAKVDAQAQARELLAVLAELPESDRDALLLFAWADLKYEEIAAALGVPIGTVRSRIHRARARLRASLTGVEANNRSDDHG
jgi:RNA polymerase sigma factor (sigma-70 family)